jgi:syntaxin 5
MSNVRDRTGEFAATIDSLLNRSIAGVGNFSDPLLGVRSPSVPKSPNHAHTEFTRRATEINVGIQRVLSMLEKLTKLARNKTLFDDRPVEVQDLTQIIKVEIAKLNGQIADLQNFQRMRKTGGYTVGTNKSAEEHSSQVVVSLQSRLAEASSTFTNVLEMRSQNIKAQRDRRDQFSATNIMPGKMENSI